MLILARRVGASTSGGAVHAYTLPDAGQAPRVWRAACGAELDADEVERVPRFTGAPCPRCLIVAFGEEAACAGHAEVSLSAAAQTGISLEQTPKSPTGFYAVALYAGNELHWVSEHAIRGRLDGREVVQALCGHLGWGPLEATSIPRGWPTCSECREVPK